MILHVTHTHRYSIDRTGKFIVFDKKKRPRHLRSSPFSLLIIESVLKRNSNGSEAHNISDCSLTVNDKRDAVMVVVWPQSETYRCSRYVC